VQKRHLYARAGVRYYWIVDPDARVLEALELKDGVWIETDVYDEPHAARIVPFDANELEVGRFFLPREADEL
jgi:Uma2 family endonuclease